MSAAIVSPFYSGCEFGDRVNYRSQSSQINPQRGNSITAPGHRLVNTNNHRNNSFSNNSNPGNNVLVSSSSNYQSQQQQQVTIGHHHQAHHRRSLVPHHNTYAAMQSTTLIQENPFHQNHNPSRSHSNGHHTLGHSLSVCGTTNSGNNTNNNNNNNVNVNNNNCSKLTSSSSLANELLLHKKLDRSMSEPATEKAILAHQRAVNNGQLASNSSRYKTELCRPFEENGTCKYGDKCQFAHGMQELRNLQRHPKYKTELCRTFHTTGFCPYGPRCHFIHNSEETKKSVMSSLQSATSGNNTATTFGNGNNHSSNHSVVARMRSVGAETFGHQMSSSSNKLMRSNSSNVHHGHNSSSNRPKSMSVGSFSLGSSSGGEISPPSSPSSSPTSLGSFFSEDPFSAFNGHHHHHVTLNSGHNNVIGGHNNSSVSSSHHQLVQSSTFPFNVDFGVLLSSNPGHSPPPTMTQQVSPNVDTSSNKMQFGTIGSHHDQQLGHRNSLGQKQNSESDHSSKSSSSSGVGCGSPPPSHGLLMSSYGHPGAPSSPVSSLGSDLDMMSLGGSSPDPCCGSPLDLSSSSSSSSSSTSANTTVASSGQQVANNGSNNGTSIPRLPTFARFSNGTQES